MPVPPVNIPFGGFVTVPMRRAPYSLPTLIDANWGYMGNQFSPDASVILIKKLSEWWWNTPTIPESQYLSMLFDQGSGSKAADCLVYKPGVSGLKTFDFQGEISQFDLDSGVDTTVGTPWFQWGDYMLQIAQDQTTFAMYYRLYNIATSRSLIYRAPTALDFEVSPNPSTLIVLNADLSNPVVRWFETSFQVYAALFSAVCSDGTEIPILRAYDTVSGKVCVMPFDVAGYQAGAGYFPFWTHTTLSNPFGIDNIYVVPNVAAKTNFLIWTHNGFSPTGTIKVATLTIDGLPNRRATVGPFVTYSLEVSPAAAQVSGSVLQTSKHGLLLDDGTLGHIPLPWLPDIVSAWYAVAPDLSQYVGFVFTGDGNTDFDVSLLATPEGPNRPRIMALDDDGIVWIWDFRAGRVWSNAVFAPVVVTKPDLIYTPPLPYRLPPVSSCVSANFRATKMKGRN